jgi:hypothetical protein
VQDEVAKETAAWATEFQSGLDRLESELRRYPGERGPAAGLTPRPLVPYKGPESYDYSDRGIFTGRDDESERLIRLVTIYRGAIVRAPGSWKIIAG